MRRVPASGLRSELAGPIATGRRHAANSEDTTDQDERNRARVFHRPDRLHGHSAREPDALTAHPWWSVKPHRSRSTPARMAAREGNGVAAPAGDLCVAGWGSAQRVRDPVPRSELRRDLLRRARTRLRA